ncbi:hypothetical protein JOL79_21565 [Microbispora sp. RL4-1S]|uniref:Uncharacterized protein n=1 Tax=Microbispora oryzae TaxID=2806554 RepID=A0A940WN27_9ACTN|nr:hypothetical protein [Microbispora oryzae]
MGQGDPGERGEQAKGGEGVRQEVSGDQFAILLKQCRYADTRQARHDCRDAVRARYRIGARNPLLDCRTYSGVTVCGPLPLSPVEEECVTQSVAGGLTRRRAEVECFAFR